VRGVLQGGAGLASLLPARHEKADSAQVRRGLPDFRAEAVGAEVGSPIWPPRQSGVAGRSSDPASIWQDKQDYTANDRDHA
jgi:hypothetical protein